MYNIREYIDLISSINVIVDKTELKNSTVLCILILYVVYCDKNFHDFLILNSNNITFKNGLSGDKMHCVMP